MAAELARLDLFKPGLARLAAHYVATAAGVAVLDQIEAAERALLYYMSPYHRDHEAKAQTKRATDLAMVTGAIPVDAAYRRLLEVRIKARLFDAGRSIALAGTPLPLIESFFDSVSGGVHAATVDHKVAWERLFRLDALARAVAVCAGTMVDLFGYLIDRGTAQGVMPGSWHACDDFAGLVHADPAAFAAALHAIRPFARRSAISLAEHHGITTLPAVLSALVAMLTRPFGKDDRELAVSTLARLDAAVLADVLAHGLAKGEIDVRVGLVQAAGRHGGAALRDQLAAREPLEKAGKVKAAIRAVLEAGETGAGAPGNGAGYQGIDGSVVAIPPAAPLAFDPPVLPEGTRAGFDAAGAEIAAWRAAPVPRPEAARGAQSATRHLTISKRLAR